MTEHTLPVARWGADGWTARTEDSGGHLPGRLRVVTLNTWFDHQDRPKRLAAQLATFEALAPDVIALQEVTADLVDVLLRAPWVRAGYAVPDARSRSTQTRDFRPVQRSSGSIDGSTFTATTRRSSLRPWPISLVECALLVAPLKLSSARSVSVSLTA